MEAGIVAIFLLGAGLTQSIQEIFSRYSDIPLVVSNPSPNKTNNKPYQDADSAKKTKGQYDSTEVDTLKLNHTLK